MIVRDSVINGNHGKLSHNYIKDQEFVETSNQIKFKDTQTSDGFVQKLKKELIEYPIKAIVYHHQHEQQNTNPIHTHI